MLKRISFFLVFWRFFLFFILCFSVFPCAWNFLSDLYSEGKGATNWWRKKAYSLVSAFLPVLDQALLSQTQKVWAHWQLEQTHSVLRATMTFHNPLNPKVKVKASPPNQSNSMSVLPFTLPILLESPLWPWRLNDFFPLPWMPILSP